MRSRIKWFFTGVILAGLLLAGSYQLPTVKFHLEWRIDAALGIVRGWIFPHDVLPTPSGAAMITTPPTTVPSPTPDVLRSISSPTPVPTPIPLPEAVMLPSPEWEKQDWNNCGPATLALALRFFGWAGDQFEISDLLKPDRGDKNVNIEELIYFVRNRAGWLEADFRVGGTIEILKRFLAMGFPVVVEKGYVIESDGPDDGWAGHYMLLTGYDDSRQIFVGQDSFIGPDREITYADLNEGWKAFNHVYMFVYPVADPAPLELILGPDFDVDVNRERALARAQGEIEVEPEDEFAWFNLGSNQLYFERYPEAAGAYDTALTLGLPWRFTRYQFGPYIAYFHSGRTEDVIALAEATLQRTAKAEEALLWRGWAHYRLGDVGAAIEDFRAALKVNANYLDAHFALEYLGVGP
ncbi:MAG: tetratricopeptide repeat protein [Anaerolineales bacterium]